MSNMEWKKGYEEGFAAGWKAAKAEVKYVNHPPVYYNGNPNLVPTGGTTGPFTATMADSTTFTFNDTKVLLNEDC